jgi:hypothetical protein
MIVFYVEFSFEKFIFFKRKSLDREKPVEYNISMYLERVVTNKFSQIHPESISYIENSKTAPPPHYT